MCKAWLYDSWLVEKALETPALLYINQMDEYFLRGAKYSHEGPCQGTNCSKCYKYRCVVCMERSNLMMTCLFCKRASIGDACRRGWQESFLRGAVQPRPEDPKPEGASPMVT